MCFNQLHFNHVITCTILIFILLLSNIDQESDAQHEKVKATIDTRAEDKTVLPYPRTFRGLPVLFRSSFTSRLTKWLLFNRKQGLLLFSHAVLCLFLLAFCRFHSARDPRSYIFEPNEGYRPQYSIKRVKEALQFISKFNKPSKRLEFSSGNLAKMICIGIATVKRPLEQNLDVTIGSLLEGLSQKGLSAISLHVLFAHSNPLDHPVYSHPRVSNVVDTILTYETVGSPLAAHEVLEKQQKIAEKSLSDYRLTLKSCYNRTTALWIVILDDVLAQKNWYEHTLQSLQTVRAWESRGVIKSWLYLQLFYTEKLLGSNSEDWPVYLVWCLVASSLPTWVGVCGRRRIRSLQ